MRNHRARTATELAVVAAVLSLMAFFIRPGEGGEDLRKIHSGVDCTKCHAPVADIGGSDEIPDPGAQCSSCHTRESLNSNTRLPFHLSTTRQCVECHSFHKPDIVTVRGASFHLRFQRQGSQALCGGCHAGSGDLNHLSAGHRKAAELYHSDNQILTGLTASQACLVCHSSSASMSSVGLSLDGMEIPRFDDHGHPIEVAVVPGSGQDGNRMRTTLDPRIPLFNQRVECETCHSLTSTSRHLLTGSMNTTELCQGCHQLD